MEYIILNGKTPTHGFKNGQGTKTWNEVKDFNDVACIVPKGYVVLDFDTKSDAEIMLKIVESLDLKTRVMKTTRGIHCWFKSPEENPKNFIKSRLAIGIYCDRKAGGRNAYVKIKQDGHAREWIRKCKAEDMEVVPKFLTAISNPSGKFEFKGMGDGSGRNQELFNYIVYLQTKGFTRDEIRKTIEVINEYVFADPLSGYEIETICRDEAFKPDDVIQEQIEQAQKKTSWSHNEFGDELINTFHIITVNNQSYVYEDGFYQQDEKIIERKMIDIYPSIKQSQRSEVLSYIRIKTYLSNKDIHSNPYIINLKNTRLDIRDNTELEFSPNEIEFSRIPVIYDPTAYSKDLEDMINRVFKNDQEVIELFDEVLGYILMRHCLYEKAFIFYGSGSNGKSTILDLIKAFIGPDNYSTIELDKLTSRFQTAELENKMVNIGDDINQKPISDSGTLKKIFSGNSIQVERKGQDPFTLSPYAKHIFACNDIPKNQDKSVGMYRRLVFIPFNAVFSSNEPGYDPLIKEKITTNKALSYLLNRALKGAKQLIKRKDFIQPKSVSDFMERYKIENSLVLTWIDETEITSEKIIHSTFENLYKDFKEWCSTYALTPTGPINTKKEICNRFGVKSYRSKSPNGDRVSKFRDK